MLTHSNPVLSVRVTRSERDLLETAAEHARTNLSEFIRRRAIEAAEIEVLGHGRVVIAADDWEKFEAWAYAPAKCVPAVARLADSRPEWQK